MLWISRIFFDTFQIKKNLIFILNISWNLNRFFIKFEVHRMPGGTLSAMNDIRFIFIQFSEYCKTISWTKNVWNLK